MTTIDPDTLRSRYLNFLKQQGHVVIPSAALVPENDPTTLFTGSGMQPILPYLLGQPHPQGKRLTNSQKCFRSQDIEEVGDNRHTTFFEMLGNWSLGDYFKREQLQWIFAFFTQECGLDPAQLYVTVYRGNAELGIPRDDEAVKLWQELFTAAGVEAQAVDQAERNGLQGGRIFYYGDNKNWWSRAGAPQLMPIGEPGGPDSEVFFDFGEARGDHQRSEFADQPCHVNCDCGRFLEIGNSVFMAYQKTEQGFQELTNKNIDFGGGFERILAAMNQDPDMFKTALFTPLISYLEKVAKTTYDSSPETTRAFRVIADHMRAAVMLAADGVFPSNKEQGYYARRLIRRSIRYGLMIGIDTAFVAGLVPIIAQVYRKVYPEVEQQQTFIQAQFSQEEEKFSRALAKGLRELDHQLGAKLTAELAFQLYETYGFPLEMSIEEAERQEVTVEDNIEESFYDLKNTHAAQSRQGSAGKFKGGLQDHAETTIKYHTTTHLLHAALRKLLGLHVQQKGSNITTDRLRFDFSHPQPLSAAELQQVEQQINDWIAQDLPVTTQEMSKQAALEAGATAFFLEKYPDQVTVYTIGQDAGTDWISKEFCGGPHVTRTGQIGQVELFKEQSVAAGVRRVYARLS